MRFDALSESGELFLVRFQFLTRGNNRFALFIEGVFAFDEFNFPFVQIVLDGLRSVLSFFNYVVRLIVDVL